MGHGRKRFGASPHLGRRRHLVLGALAAIGPLTGAGAEPVSRSYPRPGLSRDLASPRPLGPALRFREALGHAVVVPVYLEGKGPFDMVLDTATRFTTLDPGLVAELGLEPLGRLTVVTVGGAREAARARLRRLSLGSLDLGGVDVVLAEVPVLRRGGARIRGLLGQSALATLSFGIDHARRVVFFDRPAHADAKAVLEEREGRPAVRFTSLGGDALTLVLDSGISAPVLFRKAGSTLLTEPLPGFFEVETNSGVRRLAMVRLEGQVGRLALERVVAAVQDDAAAGGREEDGLLPTRLFRSVYFDRTEGEILLKR